MPLFRDLNQQQKIGVQSILNAHSYPSPYIVFGPPGTGKTRTLVATVEQLVVGGGEKILICTMTNAAADEIAIRLFDKIPKLYRFYAVSFDFSNFDKRLVPYSNYSEIMSKDEDSFPPLTELYGKNVIVTTLVGSSMFMRAPGFNNKHLTIWNICAAR